MNLLHLKIDTTIRFILGILFISISIIAAIAPITQSVFGYPNGEKIYSLLSPICHQYPTRSLWITNRPFALCSRCFGGYLGLGLSFFIIHSSHKYIKRFLIGLIMILPGIIDGLFQLLTTYESINITRLITGIIGGIGFFLIIYPFNSNRKINKTED